jgi:hypothetical protein
MKYTSSNEASKSFHLPAGDYVVTIVEASETVSRSTGADMIKLTLEANGPDDTSDSTVKIFDYLVASPSSAWKIDAFRRALGQQIIKGEAVELAAESLVGRTLRARLKVEDFEGRQNNKVDAWLAPLAGAMPAPSAPAAPAAAAVNAQNTDEDVPF